MSADAYDIAPPDPSGTGQARATDLALTDAGVQPADVVHVNAHATSTPAGDGVEAAAIRNVLGASALVALAISPQDVAELGFQLSYLAVLGILVVAPALRLRRPLSESLSERQVRRLIAMPFFHDFRNSFLHCFHL